MLTSMEWRDRHVNMHAQELVPLEAGHGPRHPPRPRLNSRTAPKACCQTPLKVARLLILLILLPTIFIVGPLYMRYRVFSSQMYPMSMTDMRLIDGKVSPTWCQRQVVKSNTIFNAFVVPSAPELSNQLVNVSMTRQMTLKADMKEYWGFYLLHGSAVTVSACVQHPGASLIMIKGYKHLQDCAYIGDDSSEEADELQRAKEAGLLTQEKLEERLKMLKKDDGKANQPDNMKRHTAGVKFHDPRHGDNVTSSDHMPYSDDADEDPKELRAILERLNAVRQAAINFKLPEHLVAVPEMHRHRDTNVDREEQKFLTFNDLFRLRQNQTAAVENVPKEPETATVRIAEIPKILNTGKNMTQKDNHSFRIVSNNTENSIELNEENLKNYDIKNDLGNRTKQREDDRKTTEELNEEKIPATTEKSNAKQSMVSRKKEIETKEENNNRTRNNDEQINEDKTQVELIRMEKQELTLKAEDQGHQDSKEIFEDVLKRLQALGERGRRVLKKLHRSMGVDKKALESDSVEEDIMSKVNGSSEELDHLRRVLVGAIDEERTRPRKDADNKDKQTRGKRQIVLGAQAEFERLLNEDDESRDYAAEEDLTPDGHAVDHEIVNDTSPYDMSRSEFWSSFSSSEEALLECEGLILNLPLTLNAKCAAGAPEKTRLDAAMRNALTYRVPANGYYFFVFNSENEVQPNFISVRFELQKTRYDVARTALRQCHNSTERCDLPLDIFSTQKVVLELPLRNNDSLWNEQFVVVSECEPRTSIYLACAIAVPLLIMIFAFQ